MLNYNTLMNIGSVTKYSPIVWINTEETERALSDVFSTINLKNMTFSGGFDLSSAFQEVATKKVYVYTPDKNFCEFNLSDMSQNIMSNFNYDDIQENDDVEDLVEVFDFIKENQDEMYVFITPRFFQNPAATDRFLSLVQYRSQKGAPMIVVSNEAAPDAIKHLTFTVTLEPLTVAEIEKIVKRFNCDNLDMNRTCESLLGLSYIQILQTLAYVTQNNTKAITIDAIEDFKSENFDATMLEIKRPNTTLKDMGGYHIFKNYVEQLPRFYTQEAKEFGIEPPKGFIAFGVPGCSKTVSAEIVANTLGVPLVILNLSKIMEGVVGASERNMEMALNQVRDLKRCVLLIDEAEKLFGGCFL